MTWLIAHTPLAFAALAIIATYCAAVYVVVRVTCRVLWEIREYFRGPDPEPGWRAYRRLDEGNER